MTVTQQSHTTSRNVTREGNALVTQYRKRLRENFLKDLEKKDLEKFLKDLEKKDLEKFLKDLEKKTSRKFFERPPQTYYLVKEYQQNYSELVMLINELD